MNRLYTAGFATVVLETEQLQKKREQVVRGTLRAGTDTIRELTREGEQAIERAYLAANLGKLSRGWDSQVYPRSGIAREPAGEIFVKGRARTQGAMKAYAEGSRIVGKNGQWLAIPLPAAGQRSTGRAKVPLTPAEWERRTGLRLRFVYRRNRPSLLVLDEGVISGKRQIARINTARRRKTGRGNLTIPIFALVPFVDVAKRVDIPTVLRPIERRMKPEFASRVAKLKDV